MTKARRFKKLRDGQWSNTIRVTKKTGTYKHRLKCCDCGLVHVIEEKLTDKGLRFRAWRQSS